MHKSRMLGFDKYRVRCIYVFINFQ